MNLCVMINLVSFELQVLVGLLATEYEAGRTLAYHGLFKKIDL